MSNNTANVSVLDIQEYTKGSDAEKMAFAEKVGKSFREIGFLIIENHDVDAELVEDCYAACEKVFEKLSVEQKMNYTIPNEGHQRGYNPFGLERAKDNQDSPDLKEFWMIGRDGFPEILSNLWPEEVPAFQEKMTEFFNRLDACGNILLEACALAIGEEKNFLSDMTRGSNTILRPIHYPPIEGGVPPGSTRAAAHEDINLITLLVSATQSGLELQDFNGEWMQVVSKPGALIVNVGDMLQNLTNGYFASTTHRVVNPAGEDASVSRYSMPFFIHPRSDISLAPRENARKLSGGEAIYRSISAGDYLRERLIEIGVLKG